MSSQYTKAAQGQECQIRIPYVCSHNPETTVFAHLGGGGMGMKKPDIHGSFACSECHDAVDGRRKVNSWTPAEIRLMHYEGMERTQVILIKEGYLIL